MPRWRDVLIPAGFAAMVQTQRSGSAWAGGDPLCRLRIPATHDHVDRAAAGALVTGGMVR